MKKLLSVALMCLCSLVLYAQKDVTTFLGIPVDGTKAEMIEKLKAKGFTNHPYDEDALRGEFNGADVNLFIVTNNNKVCRIAVSDVNVMGETDIKIRFNNLCSQFVRNEKYMVPTDSPNDYMIPNDENISYEMTVNNKRYEAAFYQCPVKMNSMSDFEGLQTYVRSRHTAEELSKLTESQLKDLMTTEYRQLLDETLKRLVWFTISEYFGSYRIVIYYDNEYNRASGEDL